VFSDFGSTKNIQSKYALNSSEIVELNELIRIQVAITTEKVKFKPLKLKILSKYPSGDIFNDTNIIYAY